MLRTTLPRLQATRKAPTLAYKSRHVQQPKKPPTDAQIRKWRRISWIGGMLTAGSMAFYAAYVYMSYRKEVKWAQRVELPKDVSDRYDRIAQDFDAEVNTMEWMMGIRKLRKRLARQTKGHVLEMSAGTGRNMDILPLLQNKIKSITMVDKSPDMIRVARLKWAETNPWFINASFRVQDGADIVPCPSPAGFDTIIQTMGICSTGEPEAHLRNMGRMTNPDGGRILLLEHGRSHYRFVNDWIDGMAPAHANRYGCWFNKDIETIVKRSGLEIVEQHRYFGGTTYMYELKPSKELADEGRDIRDKGTSNVLQAQEQLTKSEKDAATSTSWLWSWWK